MKILIGMVIILLGCATPQHQTNTQVDPSQYRIVVMNEWTDVLAVATLPYGPKMTLNPGDTRSWRLSGGKSIRYRIVVRRGRHSYESGIFIPSPGEPCWVLQINYRPPATRKVTLPGPVPCRLVKAARRF